MSEWVYLLECKPYDPIAASAKNVYFAKGLMTEGDLDPSNPYILRLQDPYTHECSVFEENSPGVTTISIGSSSINNADGRLDYLLGYNWDGRQVTVKRGVKGAALGTYVTEFVGSTLEITATQKQLVLTLRDNSYKLEKLLQTNKFAGSGGAEGGNDLKDRRKPILFGKARNMTPVSVETAALTYQIHDGAISSVDAVYDQGNPLTFNLNNTTYANLIAATIPPGSYNTCLATGHIRLGAPAVGVPLIDAVGQYSGATNIPELARQILVGRFGLTSGDLNTASFTEASADCSFNYEGFYFPEPEFQMNELMETFAEAIYGFWYVNRAGLITLRQFKFRTPSGTLRAEDIMSLGKSASPVPLYRVTVNYAKNMTVQPNSDFTIPKQTFNGYLSKRNVNVDATSSFPASVANVAQFRVFLNDQSINALGEVQFKVLNGETWLSVNSTGDVSLGASPGGAGTFSAVLRANLGEFFVDETISVTWDNTAPFNDWTLNLSGDRFFFDDYGDAVPSTQIVTLSVTSSNGGTLSSYTAVDNLGNSVSTASNQVSIANVSVSPFVFWVDVTATSTTGMVSRRKIVVQRGTDAYAQGIIGALSAANSAITVYYSNTAPASPSVDDLWYDLDDANKVYRWTGSTWSLVADTRIVDALTQSAGAQATADGKIKTFFGESTPTATAVGDLWYKDSTKTLYRWSGTNWTTQVGTWGADWSGSLTGIPANLSVLTGTEAISNQLLIDVIANDDILAIGEKLDLMKLDADLEARYSVIMINATAQGMSTTALTSARTSWRSLLNVFNPVWNNTAANTTIFNNFFTDKDFPTGWTLSNATAPANGNYYEVTDATGAASGSISRTKAQTGSTTYSCSILVQKDAIPKTTRWSRLRLKGTSTIWTCNFATNTGEYVLTGSSPEGGVLDMGDEWLVWLKGTLVNGTDTVAGMDFWPAAGASSDLTTTSNAATGSALVREPRIATGGWQRLGRHMLPARLAAYQNEITKFNAALAQWTAVSGVPANLTVLVGTEALNNQLVFDTISNDDIVSKTEKLPLRKLVADLENRYNDLYARATVLGLSTSALTSARTDWYNVARSVMKYQENNDTSIYTNPFFPDEDFPGPWTVNGSATVSTSGIWTTIADLTTGGTADVRRSLTVAVNGTNRAFGIYVRKDAANNTWAAFRIFSVGSITKYGDVVLNPATGVWYEGNSAGGGITGATVFDLGDEYFVCGVITTGEATQTVGLAIQPAFTTTNGGSSTPTATGTIQTRNPRAAVGTRSGLGRPAMDGFLSLYVAEMVKLAKAISERDGTTGVVINPFAGIEIAASNTGVIKSGQLPKTRNLTASVGTANVTTLGAWTIVSLPDGVSATIGSATGVLSITAYPGGNTVIPVQFVYQSVTRTANVPVSQINDPPTQGGSGGGTGGTTNGTTTIANTNGAGTYNTTTNASDIFVVKTGTAGQIVFTAPIVYSRNPGTDVGRNKGWGKFQTKPLASGSFADVGAEIGANTDSRTFDAGDGTNSTLNGNFGSAMTQTKTGLSANADYQCRWVWRESLVSGDNDPLTALSGTVQGVGS